MLLKPLPFPDSEQLVDLSETFKPNSFGSVSAPNFEDWKNQNTVFAGISAYQGASFNLEGGEAPQRISGLNAGANYLQMWSPLVFRARQQRYRSGSAARSPGS